MSGGFAGRIMVGIDGMEITPEEEERLRSPLVGGCILFGKGYGGAEEVARLSDAVRAAAGREIVVAVDQEGGRVQRFRGGGFSPLPAMGRVGAAWARDPQAGLALARDCGLVMAGELRRAGIDLSFAPVLDVDHGRSQVIGDRALSGDPAAVVELARSLIGGMREAGMRACGKHFPGHGFCAADSHVEYPVDSRHPDEILEADALPYRHQERIGIDAVMTAHVLYPKVDSDQIATYSSRWLKELLRERIGFDGLAVSDDLCMGGADLAGGMPGRIRAAVDAGCDLVLVCHRWDRAESEEALGIADAGSPNPWLRLAPTSAPPAQEEIDAARGRIAGIADA